jgi:adenylyltransferase/sulfurtransferase
VSSFAVIGVGGLGTPVALALARAGAARLVLVDPDRVELSNLQRQILFTTDDVGALKVDVAAAALGRRYPDVVIETRARGFQAEDVDGVDVVIEGTDSPATKFLVNDACVAARRPAVIGGVLRDEGQIFPVMPGGPCYRCLFEAPPTEDEAPSCAQAGVLGATCGIVAARMARAALDLSTGSVEIVTPAGVRSIDVSPRRGCCA